MVVKIKWEQLSPSQQLLLQRAWELNHHHGEPLPSRNPSKLSMLHDLVKHGLLNSGRYQDENCFNITDNGRTLYLSSPTYAEWCRKNPNYARRGT
jgi:DNA-binding PadR family transcriptional regulator